MLLLSSQNKVVLAWIFSALWLTGCATALPWPERVDEHSAPTEAIQSFSSRDEVVSYIEGHYAHYDVVAYEDNSKKQPMRTFIISYGFTDFYVENEDLMQQDRFCHAEQKINFRTVESSFNDKATQAIKPPAQAVELTQRNGQWHVYRPPTPTLLGIQGDRTQPLSRDSQDPNIIDADLDGKPGVTVDLLIGGFLKGEIYLTRREIFENHLVVKENGRLEGYVKDSSEQFVLGASMKMLAKPSDPSQLPEPERNPLILVKIDPTLNRCDELMARRDEWFPPEPEFY